MEVSTARGWRRFALALALAFALSAGEASAQVLAPGTSLRLIETASFDLYFPPELEAEAALLASFAEEVRAELLGLLGLGGSSARPGDAAARRLPVLLTDAFGELNGQFSPYPSNRIVLRAVPPELDGELGSYAGALRSLFTHELAHALSLSIRGPLGEGLAFLVGDPFLPANLAAPSSFIEGFAVAAESRGGEARAQDPRNLAFLRQALLEGRAPSFWQAAGARDLYPFGASPYLYGGAFSAWLLERYGPEPYAALFRDFGRLRGLEDGLFGKGAFSRSFGLPLEEAWSLFLADRRLEAPLVTALEPLVEEAGYIRGFAADSSAAGRRIFWADASAGAVLALELGPGAEAGEAGAGKEGGTAGTGLRPKPRRLFAADGHVNRLALSPDGKRLLVSTARLEGDFSTLVLKEWELEAGAFVGREIEGIREAAYAGPAGPGGSYPIVGIAPRGFQGELVLEEGGRRRVLLPARPDRELGPPTALGGSIYLLARVEGQSLLLRLEGREARVLAPAKALEGLRYLGASAEASAKAGADRLAFGFAEPGGLYRLGLLEGASGETPRLRYQSVELSGGIRLPVPVPAPEGREELYYLSRLAEGERPAAYPFENPALALAETEAAWVALDPSFLDPPAESLGSTSSRPAPAFPLLGRTFRYPILSEDLDAAGLGLLGEEIGGRLGWEASALYGWEARAASLGLDLECRPAPWLLRLRLKDGFSRLDAESYLRESSASLGIERSFTFLPARRRLGLGLSLEGGALDVVAPGSAYAGDYGAPLLAGWTWIEYSELRSSFFPPFALAGASARLSLDAELGLEASRPAFGLGLKLLGALPSPPLELELHGALGLGGGLGFGTRRRSLLESGTLSPSLLAPGYPSYLEYRSLEASGSLYGFGEARLLLAAAEIQGRLFRSPLYLRRLLLRAGLRGAAIGGELSGLSEPLLLSSAFGRLELEAAPLLGSLAGYGLVAGLELAYPFERTYAEGDFRLGLLLGLRF